MVCQVIVLNKHIPTNFFIKDVKNEELVFNKYKYLIINILHF